MRLRLNPFLFLMFATFIATVPAYADGGAQISACIAALPPTGGVCDFRNQGAQTAGSTIVINKPVTLLLDGTQLTSNGTPGMLIEADGVRIEGSTGQTELIQGGTGGGNDNVIYGNMLSDLTIEGLTFVGIPGSTPRDNMNAILLQNAAPGNIRRVRVAGNVFTEFCLHAVMIQNASGVRVEDNVLEGVADGIRFSGVVGGKILGNTIRDTMLPNNGAFAVAIGLDTTSPQDDGVSYPICRDIQISHNTVSTYVNGEAIMVHAGAHVLISDNVFENVLMGIGLNPFNSTDLLYHVTVTGNSYEGTTTEGALASTGNYGIYVGGGEGTVTPSYVIVTNNIIGQANEVVRGAGQGGIGIGYADHVLVEGNIVHDSVCNGIKVRTPNARIVVRDNYVTNIVGPGNAAY
jgi:hypothetical protein